jgi:hypothetical protein
MRVQRFVLVSHWAVYSNAAVKLIVGAVWRMAADKRVGREEALRQLIERSMNAKSFRVGRILGRTPWIAAVMAHTLPRRRWMLNAVLTRSARCSAGASRHAVRPLLRKRWNLPLPPWTCCASPSVLMCTRTAAPPESHRRRPRVPILPRACALDHSPSRASPTSPTLLAGVLAALSTPEPGSLYKYHLDRLAWVALALTRIDPGLLTEIGPLNISTPRRFLELMTKPLTAGR